MFNLIYLIKQVSQKYDNYISLTLEWLELILNLF